MSGLARCLPLVIALIAGCVVDVEPSGVGKPCPCDEDSTCRKRTCVPALGSCDAAIQLSESPGEAFRPVWWAPEAIRWEWTVTGDPRDFGSYELFLGPTAASVAPGSAEAQVVDASGNRELGFLIPPNPWGGAVVTATTTDGLEPFDPLLPDAGRYFARLEVRDKNGCPFTSDVVSRDTQRARVCPRIVFDETPIDGTLPGAARVEPGCGLNGSACLVCSAADGCLAPGGLFLSLPHVDALSSVTPSDFESGRAMLELSVAVESTEPLFYAEVGIVTEDDQGDCGETWSFSQLFLRASDTPAWQKIQIPLSALHSAQSGQTLEHEEVIASTWCALHFRAQPGVATEIRFDRVAGCW